MKNFLHIYGTLCSLSYMTVAVAHPGHTENHWLSPVITAMIFAVIAVLLAVGIDWLINRLSLSNHTKSRKNNHAT